MDTKTKDLLIDMIRTVVRSGKFGRDDLKVYDNDLQAVYGAAVMCGIEPKVIDLHTYKTKEVLPGRIPTEELFNQFERSCKDLHFAIMESEYSYGWIIVQQIRFDYLVAMFRSLDLPECNLFNLLSPRIITDDFKAILEAFKNLRKVDVNGSF